MKICRARPQLVFTFDNRFSSTGCAVQQTVRYIIFRLQASYLSATSHTGKKSCRVKSLYMKRFWLGWGGGGGGVVGGGRKYQFIRNPLAQVPPCVYRPSPTRLYIEELSWRRQTLLGCRLICSPHPKRLLHLSYLSLSSSLLVEASRYSVALQADWRVGGWIQIRRQQRSVSLFLNIPFKGSLTRDFRLPVFS
jgi:hypothetical protein